MITIGYSTRNENLEFKGHIRQTIGLKNIEIIEVVNNGEKSLTEVYNDILNRSNNDIVVLCHDDIFFNTKSWGIKVLKHFEKNEHGILGVAGTTLMPASGRWWEARNKMIGIVNHKNNDVEYESKYSTSLNNDVEDSVIVDGLFMIIHKNRIKKPFNETFDGFHFYDVSFCFDNFLAGVKLGVIYNIRLTHLSIGITNEKWEENRKKFAEIYKDELPKRLPYNHKRPLKVLISCLSFKNLTGSELYVYELSRNLVKLNCDVSILSNIGQPLKGMAENADIKCFGFENPPGYKMGDGEWMVNTPEGPQKSQPNMFYKTKDVHFDIIHTQHKPISEMVVNLYPTVPKIATIHSEIINLEEPITHDSIKHYIAIRPSIKEYIKEKIEVEDDKISIIYNPIDNKKFNNTKVNEGDYYLFVGTIDYLRIHMLRDIITKAKEENKKVLLIGDDANNAFKDIEDVHVKRIKATWDGLSQHVKNCYKVVGIKLGRTTIEGWMCGKTAIIYDVDDKGNILDITEHEPPEDLGRYESENVAKEIYKLYCENI